MRVIIGLALVAAGCFSNRPLGVYSCPEPTSPCPLDYVCVNALCVAPGGDLGAGGGAGGGGVAGGGGGGGGGSGTADVGASCASDGDCMTATCDLTSNTCELASGPPGWVPIADMTFVRMRPTVLLLADHTIMAAGGGVTMANVDASVEVYQPAMSRWVDISGNLAGPYAGLYYPNQSGAAAQLNGTLYIAGGGGQEITMQKYVPAQGTTAAAWVSVSNNTNQFIDQAGSAIFDNRLYVFGGFESANVVGGKSEFYDAGANTWTDVGVLHPPRRALGGALGSDGLMYAIGGHGDGSNDVTLATVETFATTTSSWTAAASLPQPREDLGAATGPDGRLYVVGGASAGKTVDTSVAFTPSRNHWTTLSATLVHPRSGLGVVTGADGLIYAIGGSDDTGKLLASVEVYGPQVSLIGNALHGSNFAAFAAVTVYAAPTASGTVVGTGTTDMSGTLLAPIPLTSLASGSTHTLTVMDDHSRFPVQITVTLP